MPMQVRRKTAATAGAGLALLVLAAVAPLALRPSRGSEIIRKNEQAEQAFRAWDNPLRGRMRQATPLGGARAGMNYGEVRGRLLRAGFAATEVRHAPSDRTCSGSGICNIYEEVLDCEQTPPKEICRFVFRTAQDFWIVETSGSAGSDPASVNVRSLRRLTCAEALQVKTKLV